MKDKVTKNLLIGLGVLSLTKKKVEKTVNILVKTKGLSKVQAKVLAGKILTEAKKANTAVSKIVAVELKKAKPLLKKYQSKARREGKRIAKKYAKRTETAARRFGKSLK